MPLHRFRSDLKRLRNARYYRSVVYRLPVRRFSDSQTPRRQSVPSGSQSNGLDALCASDLPPRLDDEALWQGLTCDAEQCTPLFRRLSSLQWQAIAFYLGVHPSDLQGSLERAKDPGASLITRGIVIGNQVESACLPFLRMRSLGVTHVLSVAAQCAPAFVERFTSLHIKLYDTEHDVKTFGKRLDEGVAFMHAAVESGGVVFIHCQSGISRSAAFVVAYVMRHHALDIAGAIEFVRERRSIIKPLVGFRTVLAEKIRGDCK